METTSELQSQLEQLLSENESLRRAHAEVCAENASLKKQLACYTQQSASSVEETRGEDLSPAHLALAASFEADAPVATECLGALETKHMSLQQFSPEGFEQCRRELLTPRSETQLAEKVCELRTEVHRHKAFIKELKETERRAASPRPPQLQQREEPASVLQRTAQAAAALVKVLEERRRERTAHRDLKAEVLRLQQTALSSHN